VSAITQTGRDAVSARATAPDASASDSPGELRIEVLDSVNPTVVRLVGELDAATAPRLRQELVALAEAGETRIVIDLASMTFMDSTGLGALVEGLKRFRAVFGDVVLRSPSPAARKVLDITGLTEVFTIQ
jgi:anti-sigma B factor antagonist